MICRPLSGSSALAIAGTVEMCRCPRDADSIADCRLSVSDTTICAIALRRSDRSVSAAASRAMTRSTSRRSRKFYLAGIAGCWLALACLAYATS